MSAVDQLDEDVMRRSIDWSIKF